MAGVGVDVARREARDAQVQAGEFKVQVEVSEKALADTKRRVFNLILLKLRLTFLDCLGRRFGSRSRKGKRTRKAHGRGEKYIEEEVRSISKGRFQCIGLQFGGGRT